MLVFIFWYVALYRGFFGYLVTNKVFECVQVTEVNIKNLQFE